jgi:hypothetical protein
MQMLSRLHLELTSLAYTGAQHCGTSTMLHVAARMSPADLHAGEHSLTLGRDFRESRNALLEERASSRQ